MTNVSKKKSWLLIQFVKLAHFLQYDSWLHLPQRNDFFKAQRRHRLPPPVFLVFPADSGGKKSVAMLDTWVRSLDQEDPLEEGMATHSSILAWRIPQTEEPGGLQSMESQRVRHDRVTKYTTGKIISDRTTGCVG